MPVSTEGSHRWLPERFLWQTVRRPALFRAAALADSRAGMAELVDALDSKSSGATRVGSTPTLGTNFLERRFGREGRGRAAFDAAAPSNAPTPTKTMSQIGICTLPARPLRATIYAVRPTCSSGSFSSARLSQETDIAQ
jgi:hypothetical protein